MAIKIRVGPVYSRIVTSIPDELSKLLDDAFAEFSRNAIFATTYIEKKWDGYNRYYNSETRVFRTGLLSSICTLLHVEGYDVIFNDTRPVYEKEVLNPSALELYVDQDIAVEQILKHKYGIICAPVRFGKTIIAAELVRKTSLFPFVFISQQKDSCVQVLDKFRFLLLDDDISFGFCGDGKAEVGDVTVCTIQTVAHALGLIIKNKELKELGIIKRENPLTTQRKKVVRDLIHDAKVLVIDEAHHALSRIHQNTLRKIFDIEFLIGLTATVPETLKLERALGPVIFHLSFQEAVEKGYILPTKIYWYRYNDPRDIDTRLMTYSEVYSKCITHNPQRNKIIRKAVLNAVEQDKTVVVTIKYKEHGRLLEKLIPGSVFIHGSHTTEERKKVINALQDRKQKVVISTLLREAVDIPSLDLVVNAEGGEGFISTIQRLRSITPDPVRGDKRAGRLVDFYDDYKFLKKHSNRRLKEYRKNGFEIIKRNLT